MIAHFQANEQAFENALAMVQQDRLLLRVDKDWTSPSDPSTIGIPKTRIEEYRHLFDRLSIPRGFSAPAGRGYIEFIASSQGTVLHGSSKSYFYSTATPEPLVDSLDQYSGLDRPIGFGYRHIKGNWYLKFYGD